MAGRGNVSDDLVAHRVGGVIDEPTMMGRVYIGYPEHEQNEISEQHSGQYAG